jgi:hypothetical protein
MDGLRFINIIAHCEPQGYADWIKGVFLFLARRFIGCVHFGHEDFASTADQVNMRRHAQMVACDKLFPLAIAITALPLGPRLSSMHVN